MGRAPCCSKVGLHRGPWTAREDALLIKYIQDHGEGQWRSLPKNAGLLRCGKSCRLRWMNYLRPDIKRGNITPEEDELIIRLHGLLGNRWSLIAGRLPGRTDNEIKNYWNTHISKRIRTQGSDPNTHNSVLGPDTRKRINNCNNKKRSRSSLNKSRARQKNDCDENERTKIHLPKPVRVTSMVSLTRNNSHGSFETTNVSATTSAYSSQSLDHANGLVYDPENIILDMPWVSNNPNLVEEKGFDHLMKMGFSYSDNGNMDMIQAHDKQFEKLYEEYLQLIKVDHDHDHDHVDGELLDSFTESFLI